MRFLGLIIALALIARGPAAGAAPLAVPEAKKDDPSSLSNKADQWEAKKQNDDLFKAETKESSVKMEVYQGGGPDGAASNVVVKETVTQGNAFILQLNALTACAQTSFVGRKDELCLASPNHPECIGFNVAIENASCLTPGYKPKDDTECKHPSKNDYTTDEWFAFSGQYFTGIQHCAEVKANTPTNSMGSLTDMANASKGASGFGGMVPTSGISGTVKPTVDGTSLKVNPTLADLKVPNDGSEHLGYANGEVLKRAASGDAFYRVVTESPVVEEMKPKARALVEHGLMEPNLVLDKARMAGRFPRLGEDLEEYAEATDRGKDKLPPGDEFDDLADEIEGRKAKAAAASQLAKVEKPVELMMAAPVEARPVAAEAIPPAPPAPTIRESAVAAVASAQVSATVLTPVDDLIPADVRAASTPALPDRPLMLHEKIARLEAAALAAQRDKAAGRAPTSLMRPIAAETKPPAVVDSVSLFERVRANYRKRFTALKAEEKSASLAQGGT